MTFQNSRERILEAVLKNQPELQAVPDISMFRGSHENAVQKYLDVFKSIGGAVFLVDGISSARTLIREQFDITKRIVTTLPFLNDIAEVISPDIDPHTYEDAELAVIKAHFAVAENGAAWFTEEVMGQRIIPYICQHIAVIVDAESIVPTLHEAYEKIGTGDYGFGAFIGGPSKTADIEQALVLGAHGPLTMTVFIIQ
ncbi:MAG: LUD domain-containing protein [Flavitalea sp.]